MEALESTRYSCYQNYEPDHSQRVPGLQPIGRLCDVISWSDQPASDRKRRESQRCAGALGMVTEWAPASAEYADQT